MGLGMGGPLGEALQAIGDAVKAGVDTVKVITRTLSGVMDNLTKAWGAYDDPLVDMVRSAGMSVNTYKTLKQEYLAIADRAVKDDLTMIQILGMESGELIELMNKHQEAMGRDILLSSEQMLQYGAMKLLYKEAGINTVQSFANLGIEAKQTSEIIGKARSEMESIGIRMDAVMKQISENAGKIQLYTFENGVRGFTKMAERAAEMRISMNSTLQLADKFSNVSNGLGETIKQAAKLQVLGGSFASNSNPLEMFYEATSDVGALQERIIRMFKDLGTYNAKTGQVEMSRFNRMRVKEAATQMGISPEEMMTMISTSAQRDQIRQQINNSQFSDAERKYIENTAQLNENGEAILVFDGIEKKISELTNEEVKTLRTRSSETTGQTLVDIARDVHKLSETQKMRDYSRQGFDQKLLGEPIKDAFKTLGTNTTAVLETIGGLLGETGAKVFRGVGNALGKLSNLGGTITTSLKNELVNLSSKVSEVLEDTSAEINDGKHDEERELLVNMSSTLDLLSKVNEGQYSSLEELLKSLNMTTGSIEMGSFMALFDTTKSLIKNVRDVRHERKEKENEYGGIPAVTIPHDAGGTFGLEGLDEGGLLTGGSPGVETPIEQAVTSNGTYSVTAQPNEFVVRESAVRNSGNAIETINSNPNTSYAAVPQDQLGNLGGGPSTMTIRPTADNGMINSNINKAMASTNLNIQGTIGFGLPDSIDVNVNGDNSQINLQAFKKEIVDAISNKIASALARASSGGRLHAGDMADKLATIMNG